EWPDRLARAVALPETDRGAPAEETAELIWRELAATDRAPEVRFERGQRQVIELSPAPPPGAPRALAGAAVVSGGARGIGAGIARSGGRARYARGDVADQGAVRRAIEAAAGDFGPVRLVVRAAGQTADGPVERTGEAELDAVFGGKVAGALALWRATADQP